MNNVTKLFKTSAFGFNRSDVINYIEKTRNDFYDYKIQAERTINELNDRIKELEEVLSTKEFLSSDNNYSENIDFSSSVSQINEAADHLRETADKICDDIGDFLDKILSADKDEVADDLLSADITENAAIGNHIDTKSSAQDDAAESAAENEVEGFFMSQFSQIINNTFNNREEKTESNGKTDSASILDGLLGNSVFSV